ncbi:hypothetical protein Poli38472_001722 [Pythium oligandrum]|uniref:Dienelactone hydrolase domain-containing protein n=1 Tax=Pythium oligandrum TaxID=41045 RepID=A0A8K1CVW0_PYTOL|nr:hypothetical protein Poli38472_001722 [Pythium oligandrum]|eukprot:TMW69566.1 hypothetical protein Poli38472_001722 [Pythium oligandrum]
MSSCCPPGSEPARETSSHVGSVKSFGNSNLYVAGPPTAKVGVLAFPDIFGYDSGRSKEDADRLGREEGYAVVIVDAANGDWIDLESDVYSLAGAWLKTKDYDSVVKPRIDDAIAYLKQEAKVESICSYGYCFGGWVGARLSTLDNPVIKGHVSFHPSWVVEQLVNGEGAVEKMTEAIKVPQLLLSASNDPDFVRSGGSVDQILKTNKSIASLSDVVDFEYVVHGWVNRGDLSDAKVKASADEAWERARAFFKSLL